VTHITLVVPDDPGNWMRQLPLDVLLGAARLEQRGHVVHVWDRRVNAAPPEGIGDTEVTAVVTAPLERAQCYPLSLDSARAAVAHIRTLTDRPLVALGPHGTQLPKATRGDLEVDSVVVGEVDAAALALADPASLSPVVSAAAGDPWLDDPASPQLALCEVRAYESEVRLETGAVGRGPAGLLFTVKGCPYRCSFCHLPFGHDLRLRPDEIVRREVADLVGVGLRDAFVIDYVYGLDADHYRGVSAALGSAGIRWVAQTRPEVVARHDVRAWAAQGCWGMWLGVETPEIATAKVGKRISRATIEAAIDRLRKAGIDPLLFVMVGLPNETDASLDALEGWLADVGATFLPSSLTLRPGTRLFADALRFQGRPASSLRSWDDVRAVNDEYRASLGIDVDDALRRFDSLPRSLFTC